MTRDEILSMPAGREMDALIAEKVMLIDILKDCDGYECDGMFQEYIGPYCRKCGPVELPVLSELPIT